MMLHTKYQDSWPYGFRKEDFFMFLAILAYIKHVTPQAGPFLVPGHNLNKHGSKLDDATYQISWHLALWFQIRRFLKFLS